MGHSIRSSGRCSPRWTGSLPRVRNVRIGDGTPVPLTSCQRPVAGAMMALPCSVGGRVAGCAQLLVRTGIGHRIVLIEQLDHHLVARDAAGAWPVVHGPGHHDGTNTEVGDSGVRAGRVRDGTLYRSPRSIRTHGREGDGHCPQVVLVVGGLYRGPGQLRRSHRLFSSNTAMLT